MWAALSTRRATTGAYAAGSAYPLNLSHSASSGTVTVPSRASPCHCGSSGTTSTKPTSTWAPCSPGTSRAEVTRTSRPNPSYRSIPSSACP
ncbi:hypothetical protein ASG88_21175 [Nocardioides sp. Soil777]|nr:hypothetical protein ASG88_21175 [Nocardioides sp. Soil777]